MFHPAAFSCAGSCRLFAHHARAAASGSRECPGTESVEWGFTVSPVSPNEPSQRTKSDQLRSTRWGDYFWWCTAWSHHNRKCPRSSSWTSVDANDHLREAEGSQGQEPEHPYDPVVIRWFRSEIRAFYTHSADALPPPPGLCRSEERTREAGLRCDNATEQIWNRRCCENARAVARLLEAGVLTSDLSLSRESSWQVIDWLGCCFWKALHDSWLLSVSICLSRVKKIVGFTVSCKIALNCTCI